MSPWLIIAALVSVIAAGAGGFKLGADHELAAQKREDDHVTKAVDAANRVTAAALASIRPKYTTINNEVAREIRTNTVYADCKLPPAGVQLVNRALDPSVAPPAQPASADRLRLLNQALAGRPAPTRGGELPAPDPTR